MPDTQKIGPHRWRCIDTGPADGPTNMAIDEALLSSFDPNGALPVLRLYGWTPAALSLGRFQNAEQVLDLDCCHAAGVPVVRRITGGGVIYHAAELTYSLVCAPHHLPPANSIKESFRILTSFLLSLYRQLGLDASYAVDRLPTGTPFGERTPFCFAGRESYDILIGGRKIGGNAQRRLKNAVFQHGSIPLTNMGGKGAGFLREPPVGLAEGITSLKEHGIDCHAERLKGLLAKAFQEALGIALEPSTLTSAEEAKAHLLLDKFRSDRWNLAGNDGDPPA